MDSNLVLLSSRLTCWPPHWSTTALILVKFIAYLKMVSNLTTSMKLRLGGINFHRSNLECNFWCHLVSAVARALASDVLRSRLMPSLGGLKTNQIFFLNNGPTSAFSSFIFGIFKEEIQFLQQINVKNVMSIQYTAPGLEPMISRTWVISHNH